MKVPCRVTYFRLLVSVLEGLWELLDKGPSKAYGWQVSYQIEIEDLCSCLKPSQQPVNSGSLYQTILNTKPKPFFDAKSFQSRLAISTLSNCELNQICPKYSSFTCFYFTAMRKVSNTLSKSVTRNLAFDSKFNFCQCNSKISVGLCQYHNVESLQRSGESKCNRVYENVTVKHCLLIKITTAIFLT